MKLPFLGQGRLAQHRRNTLTRDDLPVMAVVTAVGALVAMFAGCRPTGNVVGDALCAGGVAAFTIWLAAAASWWSLAVAGAVAAALSTGEWLPFLLAVAGTAVALWLGDRRSSLPAVRCASAALTVQALFRLPERSFFGATALLTGGVLLFIIGIGLQRRRRHTRRRIIKGVLIGLAAGIAATVLFGLSAASSRDDLQQGYQGLLNGLSQLQSGDPTTAASTLHTTADQLRAAEGGVGAVWAQPARLVPVVAQQQQALAALVGQAADSAAAAADALDVVDFEALTVEGGLIDVQAIALLAEPLDRLQRAVGALETTMRENGSPWLVGPLADRLQRYQGRATDAARQARAIHATAVTAPAMLGADGPRRYLIGFASPAEARATVGVMGNFAVISIDNGLIQRTDFGRINDLGNELRELPFSLQATPQFFSRYRPFGAGNGTDEAPRAAFLSNVTMTPDMPTAASLLAQMWQQTGRQPVDGVILLSPTALAGLLDATGPVVVPGLAQPLSSQTVEQFLLLDQYALDTPDRRDLLEDVADATLDAVLNGSLPAPQQLAKSLGPAATEGQLMMWAQRPDEQALMQLVGLDGALPLLNGRDGLAVVGNNASANKIDSFLERTVVYRADFDEASGAVNGTVTVTLTNTAPASGYPDYVIGSEFLEMPQGTNRTLLTVYTPLEQVGATLDGVPVGLTRDVEQDWKAFTLRLDLAPGESRTLVIKLAGSIDRGGYALVVRPQATAIDDNVSIQVGGDTDVRLEGTISRRSVLTASGATPVR